MQIDQDVDFVRPDQARSLLVVHAVDADVVVHRADHALAHGGAVFAAPRKRKYFEPAAVVQFVQFGRQDRDRMRAQVGRQVADAQALVAIAFRWRQRGRDRRQYFFVHEAARRGQLLGRIVRGAQHCQGRRMPEHGGRVDPVEGRENRPLALLLAQVHQVGQHLRLGRVEREAAGKHVLGFGKLLADLEQATHVVERLDQKPAAGRGATVGQLSGLVPHLERFHRFAAPLEQVTHVHMGFDESRIELDRGAVGGDGIQVVARVAQGHGQVEHDRIAGARAGRGQPVAIQGNGLVAPPGLGQQRAKTEQFDNRQLAHARQRAGMRARLGRRVARSSCLLQGFQ